MKIYVSVVDTKGKKSTFALREKPITIGRSPKAHVTIVDELASSMHAIIYLEDNYVYIEDYKSKNGLFLNGVKISKQRMYIDDKVRIGGTFLYFEHNKLSDEATKALTPEGSGNQGMRELTLELQTSPKVYKKEKLSGNKLFEGVEEEVQARNKKNAKPSKLLIIKEYIAQVIDFTLTVGFFFIPLLGFYLMDNKNFQLVFFKNDSFNFLFFQIEIAQYLLGAGIVIAFIFNKINRSKMKSSIGERILGLS